MIESDAAEGPEPNHASDQGQRGNDDRFRGGATDPTAAVSRSWPSILMDDGKRGRGKDESAARGRFHVARPALTSPIRRRFT